MWDWWCWWWWWDELDDNELLLLAYTDEVEDEHKGSPDDFGLLFIVVGQLELQLILWWWWWLLGLLLPTQLVGWEELAWDGDDGNVVVAVVVVLMVLDCCGCWTCCCCCCCCCFLSFSFCFKILASKSLLKSNFTALGGATSFKLRRLLLLLLLLLVLLCCWAWWSLPWNTDKLGGFGGNFLRIMPSPPMATVGGVTVVTAGAAVVVVARAATFRTLSPWLKCFLIFLLLLSQLLPLPLKFVFIPFVDVGVEGLFSNCNCSLDARNDERRCLAGCTVATCCGWWSGESVGDKGNSVRLAGNCCNSLISCWSYCPPKGYCWGLVRNMTISEFCLA